MTEMCVVCIVLYYILSLSAMNSKLFFLHLCRQVAPGGCDFLVNVFYVKIF